MRAEATRSDQYALGYAETLAGAQAGLEEELKEILARHHIPALDAEELLRSTTLEVLYQSRSVEDFSTRLGPALRHRCRRYWETRRWRFYERPQVCTPSPAVGGPPRPVAAEPPPAVPEPPRGRRWIDRLMDRFGVGEEVGNGY